MFFLAGEISVLLQWKKFEEARIEEKRERFNKKKERNLEGKKKMNKRINNLEKKLRRNFVENKIEIIFSKFVCMRIKNVL